MTKRASLSPKERKAMLEAQGFECDKCAAPIGPQKDGAYVPFIGEHWWCVALGNEQKPDCLLCLACALEKTRRDVKAIAKVKRIQKKLAGKTRKGRAIQSKGFDKSLRKKMDGTVERRHG